MKILRNKLKALALADAIIEQEWQYRYFSYNSKWSEAEEMASMSDGCGGEWFLWLCGDFAGYKCMSPDDGKMPDLEHVKLEFPEAYKPFLNEPAFSIDHATCLWYLDNSSWCKFGLPVKGLINLEEIETWEAKDYHKWATDYYERKINLSDIKKLFNNQFSGELALKINPEIDLEQLKEDLSKIGINS
ncbi:MAG: hypothetical protein OQL19_04085 [Gammaproteobacteria bacterium]|nr:hypothetical protein [Gammaproteobacteria bacterium]